MPKMFQTNAFFDVNFVNPDLNTKNFGVNFGVKRFFRDILFSYFTPSHKKISPLLFETRGIKNSDDID